MLKGRLLLVVALALSFGALGLACSDDGDDSESSSDPLDAYFAELGVIGNESDRWAGRPSGRLRRVHARRPTGRRLRDVSE